MRYSQEWEIVNFYNKKIRNENIRLSKIPHCITSFIIVSLQISFYYSTFEKVRLKITFVGWMA